MGIYVVAGGAGFIGAHIVEALLNEDHEVRVIDDLSTGKRSNLVLKSQLRLVEADAAAASLAGLCRGADAVLDLAALPSVPLSVSEPARSHAAVATTTVNLLEAARSASVRRFIFSSSSAVYGDVAGAQATEDMACRPASPYGVAKLASEHYVRVFAELYGMQTISLRYFNVFGPRQNPHGDYAAVVPRFIEAYLKHNAPTVYGDGRQTRDFTYVADVVDANLRALRADGLRGQALNIASGRAVSLLDLLDAIAAQFESRIAPDHLPERQGDIRHSQAAVAAASTALGFRAQISLADGLRPTIAWLRSSGIVTT